MIDIESIWTSESAVENLHALTAEFYNVMCNDEILPPEKIIKLDDRRDFAFNCNRCGSKHVGSGHLWSIVASTINQKTPDAEHPEVEEYKLHRKSFMDEVKHIKIRDYAEPFLKETEEWKYVEAALAYHQKLISEFMHYLCSSRVTPESVAAFNLVVAYYCEEHETNHYVSPQKNNDFRTKISGSHVPKEFIPFLSKLSQRIVLRDTSAAFRDWNESHPQTKMENVANRKKQEERAARKALAMEQQNAAAIRTGTGITKSQSKAAAKARIAEKNKNIEEAKALQVGGAATAKKSKSPITFDDPNLYILKPHLMSEDWLIEYNACGRKVAYTKVSDALIFKHTNFQEGYEVYECPYCSNWHYGRKGHPVAPSVQAKRGLRWYKRNYKKANIFIHRIMMEEF